MTRHAPKMLVVGSALALATLAVAAEPAKDAKASIHDVHDAAAKQDLAKLSTLMIPAFTWSFGGDASAEQALLEWKKDPRQLQQLARITALPCVTQSDGTVECPTKARAGARAGFKKMPEGWRMTFFVEGD